MKCTYCNLEFNKLTRAYRIACPCKKASYCDNKCQKSDWNQGGHRDLCDYLHKLKKSSEVKSGGESYNGKEQAGSKNQEIAGGSKAREIAGRSKAQEIAGGSKAQEIAGGSKAQENAGGSKAQEISGGSKAKEIADGSKGDGDLEKEGGECSKGGKRFGQKER